jgi:uncharacterized protein
MDHTVENQEPIYAYLADPATHRGEPVRRIDTHVAAVFLAGTRALKVKRAVRFPFLDFSDAGKRHAACEAELAANRPFAPQIYRGVLAITRESDGRFALDGHGVPVEWAVEMHRFDEDRSLDRLAERGEIDAAVADALGRAVASAHDRAPAVEPGPWIAALATFIDQNEAELRERPDLFPVNDVASLSAASRDTLERIRPLLVSRGGKGLVRRSHGDLHLGNIVMIEGRPVLFDALEFDPLMAAGDVLYDLAFLLMDLTERKLQGAANAVFNRYLAQTRRLDDLDGLAALPLFLSLRAAIRAKVTAARLTQTEEPARAALATRARDYFHLAQRLIEPPAAVTIAVGGLSGTGKSVLARALAPDLAPVPGAVVLRSDVERKALFGKPETERLPSEAYSPDVTAKVYAALADKAGHIVAAGHSAIVDAVFARADERAAIAAVAKSRGVSFHGLFLTAPLEARLARVSTREADASDAGTTVAREQESYDLRMLDWTRLDASGTPDETFTRARAVLRSA